MSATFWYCVACNAQNSTLDGECQWCECGGLECKRDSCSAPEHFHADHVAEAEPYSACRLCPTWEPPLGDDTPDFAEVLR